MNLSAYEESIRQPDIQQFTGDNPLSSVAVDYQPDFSADEQTIRAREAVISMGYFPAADEIIRAGMLDQTHCVQTALELQRNLPVPLGSLAQHPHAPRALVEVERVDQTHFVSPLRRVWMWCARVQRQMMHIGLRHDRLLKRAAELSDEKDELQREVARWKKSSADYERKLWSYRLPDRGERLHRIEDSYVPHQCASCGGGLGYHPVNWTGAINCPVCHATNSRRVTPAYDRLDYVQPHIDAIIENYEKRSGREYQNKDKR